MAREVHGALDDEAGHGLMPVDLQADPSPVQLHVQKASSPRRLRRPAKTPYPKGELLEFIANLKPSFELDEGSWDVIQTGLMIGAKLPRASAPVSQERPPREDLQALGSGRRFSRIIDPDWADRTA